MRVDEFRKTWIKNFSAEELEKHQHAVDVQGDPLLKIWSEAYDSNDQSMIGWYSIHYSGREFLDAFWNTLLELKPVEKNAKPKKKRASKKKTASKKSTTKKKVVARKKTTVRKKRVARKKSASLVEF